MSTPKILLTISFVLAGCFISIDASAQSSSVSKNSAAEVPVVNDKINNPDLAPASNQDEKPHVIDENGVKVYFLTDPGTTQSDSDKQVQKKSEKELILPENKIDEQLRNPQ